MSDTTMSAAHTRLQAAQTALAGAIKERIQLCMCWTAIQHDVEHNVLRVSDAVVAEMERAMDASAADVRRCREEVEAAEAAVKAAAERPTKKEVQLARCARFDPALYERRQREEEIMHAAIAEEKRFPNDSTKADAVVRARRIFANTTHQILSRTFPEEVPVA